MSISYAEKIEQEIQQMPAEYLPAVFTILHTFRESVNVKNTVDSFRQGFKEALTGKTQPIETLWNNEKQSSSSFLDYAFLNDVWQGEPMPKDLADNHDQYLYDE